MITLLLALLILNYVALLLSFLVASAFNEKLITTKKEFLLVIIPYVVLIGAIIGVGISIKDYYESLK